MIREDTVFGPIKSRRLGNSLGINLLPRNGKICNFDCIYCECGWNKDGRGDTAIPAAAQVRSALEDKLSSLLLEGVVIDSITFSGDGEPTLNPEFPRIIDDTLKLRDAYYPESKVSVLTNATRLGVPGIIEALRKVDNPILKLDAPTTAAARIINRPYPGYEVEDVVNGMLEFKGDFVLQTMFLAGDGFDSSKPEQLSAWMDIVRKVRPREIMVYTIDRPTPQQGLVRFSEAQMRRMVAPLVEEGFNIQVKA